MPRESVRPVEAPAPSLEHLLNDQREWQSNYAEMGPTPEVKKEAEASKHLRPHGGHIGGTSISRNLQR